MVMACLLPLPSSAVPASPASDEGYCDIHVDNVASTDGGRTLLIAVSPVDPGSAQISGTVAVVTSDDRRYDLPFTQLTVDFTKPAILAYRFADPVVPAAAYLSSLNAPAPGRCGIFDPWQPGISRSPDASAALAQAVAKSDSQLAVPVTVSAVADPISCAEPYRPARTISVARVVNPVMTSASGNVFVRVTIDAEGHAINARVQREDPSIASDRMADEFEGSAIGAALNSTYQTNTFRCHQVFGSYLFVVGFRPR